MLTMIIAMPPTCTYILKVFRLNSAAAKLARKACLDVEAATGTKLHVGHAWTKPRSGQALLIAETFPG